MTYKDKILLYISNKRDIADNDYLEHINYYRYHKADEVDYLETIIKKVRKDLTEEIFKDILTLSVK